MNKANSFVPGDKITRLTLETITFSAKNGTRLTLNTNLFVARDELHVHVTCLVMEMNMFRIGVEPLTQSREIFFVLRADLW